MYLALERYSRPTTIEECLNLMASGGTLLAGGTELNLRNHEAIEHLIDLQGLGLDGLSSSDGGLSIGARVTLARLRADALLEGDGFAAIREAAGGYANLALQNRSTAGGRVCQSRGDQDLPAALAALGATLHLQTAAGVSVHDYPFGDARSVLDGALLIAIEIPAGATRSAHRRFGRTAVDAPLSCVSACLRGADLRLVANVQGASAADMVRLTDAEQLASGWGDARPPTWRSDLREACLNGLASYTGPWVSGAYRQDVTATLAVRAAAAVFGEEELA